MTSWESLDPEAQVGGFTGGLSTDVSAGQLASAGVQTRLGVMSPDHPLLWFGALAAVTLGLIGFSTHAKVGPVKASLSG
jgi:hypothetical protein